LPDEEEPTVKTMHATVGICILLVVAGCSSIKVRYAYDTEADLAGLKTYAWVSRPAPAEGVAADRAARLCSLDQQIRAEVDEGLSGKGMRPDPAAPDFLVDYHVTVEDKIDVDDWGYSYAARKRYRNPKGFGMVEVAQYEKGTLIIDFVNPKTNQLIWRGEAQGGLAPDRTEKQGDKICETAVRKILTTFPPSESP
jgi:hypothetical protein